ncbi:MAG: Sel1-like repeat-containing protein kinase family protein, partial [Pseudomonadota bacterium]|nr:Sel1-like repeat-containing protein kinase family protein [Pseudomonadota bacterium]
MSTARDNLSTLMIGTVFDTFRIGHVLSRDPFTILYMAEDTELNVPVYLREFAPEMLVERDAKGVLIPAAMATIKDTFAFALECFTDEARALAKIHHGALERVQRIVRANGTAYMVLEHIADMPFDKYVESLNRPPNAAEIGKLLTPLIEALDAVHMAGLVHADIRPENILITNAGLPVLTHFGFARMKIARRLNDLSTVLIPGYSPLEMYFADEEIGPWSDIYSMAASMHFALTGHPPPDADERRFTDPYTAVAGFVKGSYSIGLLDGIDLALRPDPVDRPHTIGEWRKILKGTIAATSIEEIRETAAPTGNASDIGDLIHQAKRREAIEAEEKRSSEAKRKRKKTSDISLSPVAMIFVFIMFASIMAGVFYFYQQSLDRQQVNARFKDCTTAISEGNRQLAEIVCATLPANLNPIHNLRLSEGPATDPSQIVILEDIDWFSRSDRFIGDLIPVDNDFLTDLMPDEDGDDLPGVRNQDTEAPPGELALIAGSPELEDDKVRSYRTKAEKGDTLAQFNLGISYAEGHGAVQNYRIASYWFRKAAKQGLVQAQVNLAMIYDKGI